MTALVQRLIPSVAPLPRFQVLRDIDQPIYRAGRLFPGEPVLLQIVGSFIFTAQCVIPRVFGSDPTTSCQKGRNMRIALPSLGDGPARDFVVAGLSKRE